MKTKELQKKTMVDLEKALSEKRSNLRSFRFGEAGSRTRDVKEGRTTRREIAQILTEMRAREIAESKGGV